MNYLNTPVTTLQKVLLVVAFFITGLGLNAQQPSNTDMKTGLIVLTAFEGDVKVSITSTGQTLPPTKGAILKQGHVIVTGPNSKASLAFENGVVMEVSPSSKFVIQEFQQAPWDVAPEKLAEMKTEPSRSKTTGFLEYGDIITGVKKLKPGSSLDVGTPLGTAGIRGTDFQTSSRRNSDGSPKSFTVSVASGEVGVRSAGGTDTVGVAAGLSSTVSTSPSQSGQGGTISQPTTSPLSAATGSGILSSVANQRSSGQSVFAAAIVNAAQNRDSAPRNVSPEQLKKLEEAAKNGDESVIVAVQELVRETPLAAPEIAATATEFSPQIAPQIASAAALLSPSLAPQIAAAVAMVVPPSAPAIASSVAQAVKSAAAAIAGAVTSVAPTFAPQIAQSVANTVPESAAQIAQSVAEAQPQQIREIVKQIVENVQGLDNNAIGDAAQNGAQQSISTGNNAQPPPPSTTNPNPQIPSITPVPTPTPPPPTSTPQATPPEIRSPR